MHIDRRLTLISAAAGGIILLAGCGAAGTSGSGTPRPTTAPTVAATPNAALALATAAVAFSAADTTLVAAYNAQVAIQNASTVGSPKLPAAINAEIAAETAFDTAIQGIDTTGLPASVGTDMTALLAADSNVENAQGTLAVNTTNVSNYNAEFDIASTAENGVNAATKTLANALGA